MAGPPRRRLEKEVLGGPGLQARPGLPQRQAHARHTGRLGDGGCQLHEREEQFDTSTALGRLLLNLLASLAEFELEIIRERVKAGMDRARRQGIRIGRPRVTDRRGFKRRFGAILERLNGETISRRQAARDLCIGYATLKRLLDSGYLAGGSK